MNANSNRIKCERALSLWRCFRRECLEPPTTGSISSGNIEAALMLMENGVARRCTLCGCCTFQCQGDHYSCQRKDELRSNLSSIQQCRPEQKLLEITDRIVCTTNPAVLPDGIEVADTPLPKTDPHICSKPYSQIVDYHQDLSDLIATCQHHTCCLAA